MHPNPIFRRETEQRNIEFARERSFGTLAINANNGPLISHIPFYLYPSADVVEFHLVRSNPIVRILKEPVDAVIAVNGGDAYLSPDWYEVDNQVPTWNYIAVHLRGTISKLPDSALSGILDRTSDQFESRLKPKLPWTSVKMDQEIYKKMLRQIVPVKMDIATTDGTWKLSQNKPDEARLRAADAVEKSRLGTGNEQIAHLMRQTKS